MLKLKWVSTSVSLLLLCGVVAAATREGTAVSFSAVMQEIGSVNRFMEGSWTEGGQSYAFKVTRE